MNNNYSEKKLLIIPKVLLVILSFLFLFSFKNSYAYISAQQVIDTTLNRPSDPTTQVYECFNANTLIGTISSFQFKLIGYANTLTPTTTPIGKVTVTEYSSSSCSGSSSIVASSTTFTISTSSTNYEIDLSPNFTINSSKTYAFLISVQNPQCNISPDCRKFDYYGSNATNTYPGGTTNANILNTNAMYFKVNATGTLPTTISITYPLNQISPQISDFLNWQVQASGDIWQIMIAYADNFGEYEDVETYNFSTNGVINFGLSKKASLGSSTWWATPYVLNASGTIIASGTTIYFSTNGNSTSSGRYGQGSFDVGVNSAINFLGGGLFGSGNNATSSCTFNAGDLNIIGNGIAYGGCIISNILFVPHTDIGSEIKGNINDFATIFPFNIPFAFLQAVQSGVSSTPANATLSFTSAGLNNTTFTLLSSSSMNNLVGTTSTNSTFNVLRAIMYAGTLAHIFLVIF